MTWDLIVITISILENYLVEGLYIKFWGNLHLFSIVYNYGIMDMIAVKITILENN